MKRILVLALIPAFVLSCGGGGSSSTAATEEEAMVAASQAIGLIMTNFPATEIEVNGYNTETPSNWDAYPCITSGTYQYKGFYYTNDTSAPQSWKLSYTVTLNECKGPDLLCGTDKEFTLNGSPEISWEYRSDTDKYFVVLGGSYTYSGALNGSCEMNMTLTYDNTSQEFSYSGATGTMCGYDVSSLQAMEDSGEDYCTVLSAASAE